jgi:hypothetical protein
MTHSAGQRKGERGRERGREEGGRENRAPRSRRCIVEEEQGTRLQRRSKVRGYRGGAM